jgi:hypothetical protein
LGRLAWGCGLDSTSSEQGLRQAVVSALMNLRVLAPRSLLLATCYASMERQLN